MKKITPLIISCILLISLVGCSKTPINNPNKELNQSNEEIQSQNNNQTQVIESNTQQNAEIFSQKQISNMLYKVPPYDNQIDTEIDVMYILQNKIFMIVTNPKDIENDVVVDNKYVNTLFEERMNLLEKQSTNAEDGIEAIELLESQIFEAEDETPGFWYSYKMTTIEGVTAPTFTAVFIHGNEIYAIDLIAPVSGDYENLKSTFYSILNNITFEK